ncbi:MAG: ABC transporter permease [Deltaproteobacteria bacterium]|nr:ABC transporter permease [Deltaproteobacteria bacterium]
MIVFLIRRTVHSILVIVAVLFIVSILVRVIPGDPVDVIMAGNPGITEAQKDELRRQLGLKDPILVQFFRYVQGAVRGDLGVSLRYRTSSATLVMERLPATIELTLFSMAIAVIIAVPLGIITALRQDSALDYGGTVFAIIGVSTPNFLLGILLILVFSVELGILPASGQADPILTALGKLVTGRGSESLLKSLEHLILPGIALGMSVAGANVRMIRSAMLDVIRTDYVRFAKAKGLPGRIVFVKHAFRNALIPTVTILGIQLGQLLGGTFVLENVFAWPGIGRLAVQAIFWRDYPLVQTVVLVAAAMFVIINFLVDIIYHYIDPRIRYE